MNMHTWQYNTVPISGGFQDTSKQLVEFVVNMTSWGAVGAEIEIMILLYEIWQQHYSYKPLEFDYNMTVIASYISYLYKLFITNLLMKYFLISKTPAQESDCVSKRLVLLLSQILHVSQKKNSLWQHTVYIRLLQAAVCFYIQFFVAHPYNQY